MTSTLSPASALSHARVFGEPQLHTDGDVLALTFAPSGALWSLEEPGVLRHWNAAGDQQVEWLALSDLETSWAFSRDGRLLASASDDLTIWDASGQSLGTLPQDSWVTALAFGPDPAFLATGHDDGSIRYWDAAGRQVCELRQHRRPISALAFSSDGKHLAAAAEDKAISLWHLPTGKLLGTMKGHTDRIPALAWHPSGHFLVSAGWDTTARVWDARTLEPVILLNAHAGQVTALAFTDDGGTLATADSGLTVYVWDFASRKVFHKFQGPQGEIRCLAFNPQGKTLACNGERKIHLWDLGSGRVLAGTGPRPVARTSLCISPDGARLATNGSGTLPRVWNVAGRQPAVNLEVKHNVHGLAYSPDGRYIAGAAESHVRLWDARTGQVKRDLVGFEEPATTVAFSGDSSLLASGSSSGLGVWLWRVADGETVLLIPDALDGCTVEALAFHPQGRLLAVGGIDHLATGGSNGAISLWDLDERAEVGIFLAGTTSIAFHPSGKRLLSASLDQTLCLWDTESQSLVAEMIGHDDAVTCVAFSPDGQWLASAGADRTIRLWDETGIEWGRLEVDSQTTALAFSPDGQYLFTANANTTCYQINLAHLLSAK